MILNRIADSNATPDSREKSSEILDDVLKQLDKLSPAKKRKVLERLTAANLIDSDLKAPTKQPSTSTAEVYSKKPFRKSQNEAEIPDLREPITDTHKRKRSKDFF